jgi:cAMP-dependent protein kinase regulator
MQSWRADGDSQDSSVGEVRDSSHRDIVLPPIAHRLLECASMPEETESGATLLARREYARAVPLLKREHEKYPSNPRIRLQFADALAGAGMIDEAVSQYDATAQYYEDNGLTVQAIAVRKKGEKVREQLPKPEAAGKTEPLFSRPVPKSPLFEVLQDDERTALIGQMEVESHDEGSVIISEGDPGTSMYLIVSGEVKVYTRGAGGTVYLARLGEGDFFGEVSVLTGKPRTATITASQHTELLRLDKEKLDSTLARYPGIRKVLDDFYKKRAKHTVEAMIDSLKKKG